MSVHLKTVLYKAALLSTALGLLGFTIALAASGDLDTTFSGDGLVTSYASPSEPERWDKANAVTIGADGKIVAAGSSLIPEAELVDFAVIRYNPDGSLDTTFSGDGRLLTSFGGSDVAHDVAVQLNGKIVVVGETCEFICDVALARYNVGGSLDTTFSGDGRQITDFGGRNGAENIAIQSNGKIVVSGYMHNGTDFDFAVYRYLSNGSLDTTFSGDGMVNIGFAAGEDDAAYGLAIQSDGKIVVAGNTGDAQSVNNNFGVVRLNKNGSLDLTFDGDGRKSTNLGGDDYANSFALQPDGKFVVGGFTCRTSPSRCYPALVRYNTDGSLDTTFNGTGRKVSGLLPVFYDLVVQSDGKVVVVGVAGNFGARDFGLVRLNSDGSFDITFNGNGKVTIDFGHDEYPSSLALQPSDGKYVIGGYISIGSQDDFALARVLP